MALKTRAKKTVQVELREVSNTGVFIALTEANRRKSMSILNRTA